MRAQLRVVDVRLARTVALGVLMLGCQVGPGPSASPSGVPSARPTTGPSPITSRRPAESPIGVEPSATPGPPIATHVWDRAGSIGLEGDAVGIAGSASGSGYVVAQWDWELRFSSNLTTWRPVILPLDDPNLASGLRPVRINDVQAGSDGFLVVGAYSHEPCGGGQGDGGPPPCHVSPVSWFSSDGLTWRASDRAALPMDVLDLGPYTEFLAAWPVAGGWDAAVVERPGPQPSGNEVLHSSDGRNWTRLPSPPLRDAEATPAEVIMHAGAALPDGGRLLWQVWERWQDEELSIETTLASSADGRTWEVLGSLGEGSEVVGAVGRSHWKEGWLLAGALVDPAEGSEPAVWTSMDLREWTAIALPMPPGAWTASVTDVDDFGTGYVALGTWRDDPGLEWGATWLSANGADWFLMPWAEGDVPSDAPVFMSNGTKGLAAVGFDSNDITDVAAWMVVP